MIKPIIHLGNAGTGALECGATERKDPKNWTWDPNEATCKRCLKKRTDRYAYLSR
jgi:hypothetical protein